MAKPSQWQYDATMSPQVQLADYASLSAGSPPNNSAAHLASEVERAVAAAVARNGLGLVLETAKGGNCGPDAVLRGLENLHLPSAAKLIKALENKGREKAWQALRLLLLIWIRDHAAEELVPSMSVEDWILIEGKHSTLGEYIAAMSRSGEWFDTPMLYAVSAVFGVQLVILTPEPLLLCAASAVSKDQAWGSVARRWERSVESSVVMSRGRDRDGGVDTSV